jgi:hypothetical protein
MSAAYQTSHVNKRARRTKDQTVALRELLHTVLAEHHPMTVRQAYYQLVARQAIDNNRGQYQAISNLLVDMRKAGIVPWAWIEDRNRRPRHVAMWDDLADFGRTVLRSYRRDVWLTQPGLIEVWLEKDALSGIFEDVLASYGVTLNVGRGYDGWDSIHNAADRYEAGEGVTVLYFGDFDPSGEDMVRSLRERLGMLGSNPEIVKCALTPEDVRRYNLPPDFTKATDSRRAGFVAKYGDVSVELDALPITILRAQVIQEVEQRMDLLALEATRQQEAADQLELQRALKL